MGDGAAAGGGDRRLGERASSLTDPHSLRQSLVCQESFWGHEFRISHCIAGLILKQKSHEHGWLVSQGTRKVCLTGYEEET